MLMLISHKAMPNHHHPRFNAAHLASDEQYESLFTLPAVLHQIDYLRQPSARDRMTRPGCAEEPADIEYWPLAYLSSAVDNGAAAIFITHLYVVIAI
jgi:hypothetical protein